MAPKNVFLEAAAVLAGICNKVVHCVSFFSSCLSSFRSSKLRRSFKSGDMIGLWPTLLGIVLTAMIGAYLVRRQGFKALSEAREQSARNELPVTPVIHGVFIFIAGLLLLTPGFVTDTIGFLFLVPPVRLAIAGKVWTWINANMDVKVMHPHGGPTGPQDYGQPRQRDDGHGTVIDGEAVDLDDDGSASGKPGDRNGNGNGQSPWSAINHNKG